MASTAAGRHVSPWVATAARPDLGDTSFRPYDAQVLVVGGGVVGLTTALLLTQEGKDVVLVDSGRLGTGVTAHSTVKATVAQGLMLGDIAETLDEDAARVYADANAAGLDRIRALAAEHGIDCDLALDPHVVWTREQESVPRVRAEAELAARVGLTARLTDDVPLPFDVAAALSYPEQVSMHPVKYLYGLAEAFVRAGGTLIEDARALALKDDEPCRVATTAGVLSAEQVVVATHFPFLDRGGHFARLSHHRAYGVAVHLPDGVPAGMTIGVDSPTRSTRTVELDGERLLVVVGEGRPVGESDHTAARWSALSAWAEEHFGAGPVRYRWSTQDVSTLDKLPYVGWITPGTRNVVTATGFAGWGMTNGTAAAMLMTDLLTGEPNPWAEAFDARRLNLTSTAGRFAAQNLHVGAQWVGGYLHRPESGSPARLGPGQAAVLRVGGRPTACFRDDDGALHTVSARCTHLGCVVAWNDAERSWDCPCHASRFDVDGAVLQGPAVRPLRRVDVEDVPAPE